MPCALRGNCSLLSNSPHARHNPRTSCEPALTVRPSYRGETEARVSQSFRVAELGPHPHSPWSRASGSEEGPCSPTCWGCLLPVASWLPGRPGHQSLLRWRWTEVPGADGVHTKSSHNRYTTTCGPGAGWAEPPERCTPHTEASVLRAGPGLQDSSDSRAEVQMSALGHEAPCRDPG